MGVGHGRLSFYRAGMFRQQGCHITGKQRMEMSNIPSVLLSTSLLLFLKTYYIKKEVKWEALMGTMVAYGHIRLNTMSIQIA